MNRTALRNWQSYLGFVKGLTDLFGGKWWKAEFPCFLSRQEGHALLALVCKLEATGKDTLCVSCFSDWKRKGWVWKEKDREGGKRGHKRGWGEKSERDRGKKWKKVGRQTENKKQIGSPLISSPATHYATKALHLPRTESQLPQRKAALPALS